jgi:hypothetical protein
MRAVSTGENPTPTDAAGAAPAEVHDGGTPEWFPGTDIVVDALLSAGRQMKAEGMEGGGKVSVPVVILTGGSVVQGQAISRTEYLNRLAEVMGAANTVFHIGDGGQSISVDGVMNQVKDRLNAAAEEMDDLPESVMDSVYLKDVKIILGGTLVPQNGTLPLLALRGRAVDAWMIGGLTATTTAR